jgi:hypothetical protein
VAKRQAPIGSVSTNARSRVINGPRMLAEVDGRSAYARRFKDLAVSHVQDRGGPEALLHRVKRPFIATCIRQLFEALPWLLLTGAGECHCFLL